MITRNVVFAVIFSLSVGSAELIAQSPLIITIAGNGTGGYSGDGGPSENSVLDWPGGVTVDSIGNIYVSDTYNGRVRKIDRASGVINTIVGSGAFGNAGDGGPAMAAEFYSIRSSCFDASNNFYVVDNGDSKVRKINLITGIITTFAGSQNPGWTGDGGPATSARLYWPSHVCFDRVRNCIYIADTYNNKIRKVDLSTNIITTFAGTGVQGYSGDNGPAVNANLSDPKGIAIDSALNIYIGDYSNARIRKIDTAGIITTFAGTGTVGYSGDGGPAVAAELRTPAGIAFDASKQNLFIADRNNNVIRKINMNTTIITTVAGNGTNGYNGDSIPAISASLSNPSDVAIDQFGNIFIADPFNNRIRQVVVSTVGIKENPLNQVRVFPNPSSDFLFIENLPGNDPYEVMICDVAGKEIISVSSKEKTLKVDLEGINSGMYFLQVKSKKGSVTKKIAIEK
jgi:hypothetical protein